MDRRGFLVVLVAAYGCGPNGAPKKAADATNAGTPPVTTSAGKRRPGSAQPQTKVPRVVMLFFGARGTTALGFEGASLFRARLTELGYLEGKTIQVEERYAAGEPQRLEQLAREIVESKADVIVAVAYAATTAARRATSAIPIVMVHVGNPIGSGLVASLAQPGGNVTGTTSMIPELGTKQVDLLRQVIPGLARLGVLVNPTNAGHALQLANVIEHGKPLQYQRRGRRSNPRRGLREGSGLAPRRAPGRTLCHDGAAHFRHRAQVLDFAASNRLPASYDVGREMAHEGGLISYGPVLRTHYAHAADYVNKILKGAKPGELSVQQPTEFALVINLKTAKVLGPTIPQSLLLRAEEVIQ